MELYHKHTGIVVIVTALFFMSGVLCQMEPEEARLASYLLDHGYSTVVRPVVRQQDTITVVIDLALVGVLDMDEANQIITANTFMTQTWMDAFLTWNPEDFWNITHVQIPIQSIWRPDIILYTNTNDDLGGGIRWTLAWVKYNGEVSWETNAMFESACPMNPLYFPYDTQDCPFTLGSWTYNGDEIDVAINSTTGDDSLYAPNGEWDLISFPARRDVGVRACCEGVYPTITYNIVLKRRAMFYFFNLVLPCVLISSLVLMGFILPVDACERVTLTLTILLSLTVFLLLVAETMPPTSEVVPLISQYYAAIIIAVGLITVAAVVTTAIHNKGDSQRAPKRVRRAILGTLAKLVGITTIPIDDDDDNDDDNDSKKYNPSSPSRRSGEGGVLNPVFEDDDGNDPFQASSSTSSGDLIDVFFTKLGRSVSHFAKLAHEDAESKQTSMEWMHIAAVLDRFFVYFFALVCFLITICTIVLAAVEAS